MAALGLCYAAQGPATIKLCEQTGIVKDVPGKKIDTSQLPELGLANALDAGEHVSNSVAI
jgi:hypothetical protein